MLLRSSSDTRITVKLLLLIFGVMGILSAYNSPLLAEEGGVIADEIIVFSNQAVGISFAYPRDWKTQVRGSSERTPFAVVISDVDMNEFDGGYPEKFVNIVYYRSAESPDAYAASDFAAKKISHATRQNVASKAGAEITYHEGDFKSGKYIATYTRKGEYLVIVETYIAKQDIEDKVREAFLTIAETLDVYEIQP